MAEPRTVTAWAAASPKAKLEPITFEAPPLGENGVEIAVTHCGLCGSDVHLINSDGAYASFTAYGLGKPQVCGHEVIGTVTGLGGAVTHLKLGQRAGIGWQNRACHACEWCKAGDEQLCGTAGCTCCEGSMGGFADYIRIADGKFAFAIPDALDSAATAPLLCGGVTVWTPLVQQTKEGDRVGVLGLGGLGHMAIKFASALGRNVTALSGSTAKQAEAMALGAHAFVAHSDAPALEAVAGSLDFLLVTLATQVSGDRLGSAGEGCARTVYGRDVHLPLVRLTYSSCAGGVGYGALSSFATTPYPTRRTARM
jgi:uncharacterized zinc-type alcohol dehydrogenase-like protein